MIEAVLWDLDGTLVETEKMMPQVNGAAVARMGYIATEEDTQRWHGMSDFHIWQDAVAKAPRPIGFAEYKVGYLEEFNTLGALVETRPGATELVCLFNTLRLPQAVVTSALRKQADTSLERFPESNKFLFSISADDVPDDRTKPDPYPYLKAHARLKETVSGCSHLPAKRCLVMEDSHSGVLAGFRAGMQVAHWLRDPNDEPSPYATIVIATEADIASKLMPLFTSARMSRRERSLAYNMG